MSLWFCPPVRGNPVPLAIMQEAIQDLIFQGIIQDSDSPFSSPLVLIKKKNGSYRPCLDCRSLNKFLFTLPQNPRPANDLLASIPQDSKYFTVCDFTSAYFRLPIHPEDIKYFGFSSPVGHHAFCRLPMGLKTSSATLVATVNKLFSDIIHKDIHYFRMMHW